MASFEDEIRDLREKNSELAIEVQHWKQLAAQREREKIDLMKDVNELRLKLSKLRSGGQAEALKLDRALQAASEEALSHLVQASGAVARSIELTKQYLRDRQELEAASPRWSSLSGSSIPSTDKVHRVPPTLVGGQSIQPVVSLSRTMLNSSARSRSPNRNVTERGAVPMHLLSDVYIPLTRINIEELLERNTAENADDSADDADIEANIEESNGMSENYETSRRLDVVMEDMEAEENITESPQRAQIDNPLEGPSWLLDVGNSSQVSSLGEALPDSTTGEVAKDLSHSTPAQHNAQTQEERLAAPEPEQETWSRMAFTPTVRRRKRTVTPPATPHSPPSHHTTHEPESHTSNTSNGPHSPFTPKLQKVTCAPPSPTLPHFSPRRTNRKKHNASKERVLKVMVAKLRLWGGGDAGPAPLHVPPDPIAPDPPAPDPVAPDLTPPDTNRDPKKSHPHPLGENGIVALGSRDLSEATSIEPRASSSQRLNSSACSFSEEKPTRAELDRLANGPSGSGNGDDSQQNVQGPSTDIEMGSRSSSRTRVSRKPEGSLSRHEDSSNRHETSSNRLEGQTGRASRQSHHSASDSDTSVGLIEGRSRRPRKLVTYKEKPLNKKLRR